MELLYLSGGSCVVMILAQSGGSFAGVDGFLGTRGSLMLDVVFLAMLFIVPVMLWSVFLVRNQQRYGLHRKVQLATGFLLLVAVVAFEIDVRFLTDWEQRAEPSPYYVAGSWNVVWTALTVHLVFAVPTPVLWGVVMYRAWKRFPKPPCPATHSASHRCWGYAAVLGMLLTAVTGWVFYYLAFVAI